MSNDLLAALQSAMSDRLTSRTLNTCSRWASKRRFMGEPFPGPYSWKYHPWVKDMHDSETSFNYAMKGAQLGVTEVGINRAFYTLDALKRDVLYVLPTSLNASDFSKARFATALSNSPYLANLFTDTNTVNLKQTAGNTLYIRGSRGDSNLKSIPVSQLILDEVDEMDQKQIDLALTRLDGQLRKHVWGISTPTIPNYGIHKLYLNSTQEHFIFRCPSCSKMTELVWPDCVEIVGDHLADPRCKESFLKCKECKAKLEHQDKPDWLSTGQWVSQNESANLDIRGFYINQLYSFTVTPGELVVAYFKGFGDELAMKEFENSKLGRPFIGSGAKIGDEELDAAISSYSKADRRPELGGERIITMGVDQGKWNYYEICEWLFPSWTNDICAVSKCRVLDQGKFLEEEYDETLNRLMREWQVLACVIDADPFTMEARRFARRFPGYVWLCRYRRGVSAKDIVINEDPDGASMITVDRTNWLSASLGRFRTTGRILLPRDVDRDYREHVKNLVRTYVKDDLGNAQATYVSTGPDHFGHARNYAEMALPLVAARETQQDIATFL